MFSDILMCQAEPSGTVANVKDLNLAGGSVIPMFDSNVVSYVQSVNCCTACKLYA